MRAPRALRVLELLEHQHAGALAQHEAVAGGVPRPAGGRRIVVAGRQRVRRAEAADADRVDRRVRSAGDHHVGVAVFDQPRRLAEAVVGRRARRHRREVRTLVAVVDRDQARDHVDDRAGHEERADLARPAFAVAARGLLDHRQSADAGADAHARALAVAGPAIEAGVGDGLHRRHEAVVDERVVAAGLLAGEPLRDVEVLDLAGDARRKRRRVEARDRSDAGLRREDRGPRGRHADADGRDQSESGDDDAATAHGRIGRMGCRGGAASRSPGRGARRAAAGRAGRDATSPPATGVDVTSCRGR